jgi:hypothetical protein
MRRIESCYFEELADELDLAADAWTSVLDVTAFDCSYRLDPAQCRFG